MTDTDVYEASPIISAMTKEQRAQFFAEYAARVHPELVIETGKTSH